MQVCDFFAVCWSINFRRCSNFPWKAWVKIVSPCGKDLRLTNYSFNVFVCLFYWRGVAVGWTGWVTILISFYGSSWCVCSHAFSSLSYFTIPILVMKRELTASYKANGIWLLEGNTGYLFSENLTSINKRVNIFPLTAGGNSIVDHSFFVCSFLRSTPSLSVILLRSVYLSYVFIRFMSLIQFSLLVN